jgi:hypothetical protein
MSNLTLTSNLIFDLESLGEHEKLEAFIKQNGALNIFKQLGKRDDALKYTYGAALYVIFNDYKSNLTEARENYKYNSFKDLIDNDDLFSGYQSAQTWYNLKDAYDIAVSKGLTYTDLTTNKIKYTKLLALAGQNFETKEDLIEALKRPLPKQINSSEYSTLGLPLNPQAPPSIQSTASFTNNEDGYVYPIEDEKDIKSTFSEEQGNMEVLPPAWDNIPRKDLDNRSVTFVMSKENYTVFMENLDFLQDKLQQELPTLVNYYGEDDPRTNTTSIRNATLTLALKFTDDNFITLYEQYSQNEVGSKSKKRPKK